VHRGDGDDAPVAVLLPGAGYTPAHPLLHFCGAVFRAAGLTPLLRAPVVVRALASWRAPALAAIAERDPVPDGVDPLRLGDRVRGVLTTGTDHALETDDPVASVDVLRTVLVEVRSFVRHLDAP
jgi:hypothetical protein